MALNIESLSGQQVYDQDGSKLGSVGQIYVDDRTSEPTFVTVNMGLFGTKETLVPLEGAAEGPDGLTVPDTKDFVKDAPNIEPDGHLDEDQQNRLLQHFRLSHGDPAGGDDRGGRDQDQHDPLAANDGAAGVGRSDPSAAGVAAGGVAAGGVAADGVAADGAAPDRSPKPGPTQGRSASGDVGPDSAPRRAEDDRTDTRGEVPTGRADDDGMVRREEELHVGTERVETGRVRLRKHVTTEHRTVTVPVQHEEVEVVREPVEGGHAGGELADDVQEVTLSEDRPVVHKDVVEKERVRLDRQTRTDDQEVSADVAREEIEVEEDAASPATAPDRGTDGRR